MCSQADDPSQHGSDDTLRAALERIIDLPTVVPDHPHSGIHPPYLEWRKVTEVARAALAASATDEAPEWRTFGGEMVECVRCGDRYANSFLAMGHVCRPDAAPATGHVHTAACHSENCLGRDHD